MLGFCPISARPISGSAFSLIAVAAPMAAALSLTLAVQGTPGLYQPMSAGLQLSFAVSGPVKVKQSIAANVGLSFSLSPDLFIAGKPLKLSALPESFNLRASNENWTLKALPQDFTVRGV